MDILKRNNVIIKGSGAGTILFAHGFGCNQNMWCFVYPAFEQEYRTILFDHVGVGRSNHGTFDKEKYSKLEGYANGMDLFKPFKKEGEHFSQQGLDLGLYIAAEIARAHHGELLASSTTQETMFTFRKTHQSL